MPRIFSVYIFLQSSDPGFETAIALGQDGTIIAGHISSSVDWAEIDMLTDRKIEQYFSHAAKLGYSSIIVFSLIRTPEVRWANVPGFSTALKLNRAQDIHPDYAPPKPDGPR